MSLVQPSCSGCALACDCERVAWFSPGLFGVAWRCPRCSWGRLVVSPIGPAELGRETCTHCGAEGTPGTASCSSCGTSVAEVLSASELAESDAVLLARAREAFALGTCRRGLTLANYVLKRSPSSSEAKSIGVEFREYLDAQPAFEPPPAS